MVRPPGEECDVDVPDFVDGWSAQPANIPARPFRCRRRFPFPQVVGAVLEVTWMRSDTGRIEPMKSARGSRRDMTRTLSPLTMLPYGNVQPLQLGPVGLTAASTRSCAIPSFAKHPMVETDGHGEIQSGICHAARSLEASLLRPVQSAQSHGRNEACNDGKRCGPVVAVSRC